MQVEIIQTTPNPIDLISICAGISYGKNDIKEQRVNHCFKNGHLSVFEHAFVTVLIEGISRTCSHQLVRHRMASFVQKSQRYTKVEGDDWFVVPPAMENYDYFYTAMTDCKHEYDAALKAGYKPEDARFLLPEATKTDIVMTMNVRELFHFFDLRMAKDAQWEIRKLAGEIFGKLKATNSQWEKLMCLWEDQHEIRN